MLEEPRFDSKVSRVEHYEEIDEIVAEWLEDKTQLETVDLLTNEGISCVPVQTLEEFVDDSQLEHRGMINTGRTRSDGAGTRSRSRGYRSNSDRAVRRKSAVASSQ